jgi:MFS family permease
MKINTRDLLSSVILILFAVIGYWLNQEHALGTARRMGPGYMPMLTFWILGGLGLAVFAIALFSGPNPLEKWTKLEILAVPLAIVSFFVAYFIFNSLNLFVGNYYVLGIAALVGCFVLSIAPGWRPLGLVHAGMACFGLMLEQFGLMASLAVCIVVASMADPDHRPKGVIGMVIFLCALCWWVFIKELDIRVPVWPQFL